jgi:hypothetical protein
MTEPGSIERLEDAINSHDAQRVADWFTSGRINTTGGRRQPAAGSGSRRPMQASPPTWRSCDNASRIRTAWLPPCTSPLTRPESGRDLCEEKLR